jgi:hypothetical protein
LKLFVINLFNRDAIRFGLGLDVGTFNRANKRTGEKEDFDPFRPSGDGFVAAAAAFGDELVVLAAAMVICRRVERFP